MVWREGSSLTAAADVTGNLSTKVNPNSQVGVTLSGAGHFTGGSQYVVNDGDAIAHENLYLDMDALFSDFETNTTIAGEMDFDGVTASLTIPGLASPVNVPASFEWNPIENTGNITIDEAAVEDAILDAVAESVDHALEHIGWNACLHDHDVRLIHQPHHLFCRNFGYDLPVFELGVYFDQIFCDFVHVFCVDL